jgi:aldehyde dehydrogenase (NAD+)
MGLPIRGTLGSHVAGRWVADGEAADDLNPSRPTDVIGRSAMAGPDLADEACAAAAAAYPGWRSTPAPARGEILRQAGDLLDVRADEIGHELAREEGKTVVEAVSETLRAAALFRYYAAQTLEPDGDTYPSASRTTFLYSRREPVGVVAVITPWNFPIAIPAWKIAPALAYGNTVVWKPADLVPLTSIRVVEALVDAGLPPGVLNLIIGRGSTVGETLVTHSAVSAITFTGSNAVGRAVQLQAVARGKRAQLELGGKNPAVVLADADLGLAAEHVARGSFLSAGQKCTATSRVIVERPVMEEFSERLSALAQEWKVGDALDPTSRVGPLSSAAQLETVLGYLQTARTEGATILAGGGRADELGEGYFVRPTVLTDVRPDSRILREEIFGPVATLLAVDSYDAAIAAANDTPFGLSASVFTRDLGAALAFANEIKAGVVKVNLESAGLEYQVPFGGTKDSSSGSREQGKAAREFFTEWKTVYIDSQRA